MRHSGMRPASSWFALLLCLAAALPLAAADNSAAGAWRETIERVSPAVVSIQVDATRAFDTEWNESAQATGFVVDAERGLILTNRHVVTPGPVRAVAIFTNQEEVELTPVYRDPVHDFGFYRYDPRALRYIRPQALRLKPAGAQIGRDIRVVGNDGGEQLSILSGTMARLRREAPDYGRGKYNDFNTFYLQAASSTSGGSSGSPVIDIDGDVVALNAGASNETASSFFLPLDRVQYALTLLRAGQPVVRGTLGVIFRYTAFDELRRLGLREASEATVRRRFPDGIGMLVVSEVLAGGPAAGALQVGDILLQVDGNYMAEFVPLEAALDARVGQPVELLIERGGQDIRLSLQADDLHRFSPDEYLQFGDAVVNNLSWQQARHFNRGAAGVYVANPGFVLAAAGIPRGALIVEAGGTATNTIDDLEKVLAGLADQQRVVLRFITVDEPGSSRLRVVRMDRRWFPAVRCQRDDALGEWPCRDLLAGPAASPAEGGTVNMAPHRDKRVRRIAPSLVLVNFDMPYVVSGVSEQHYYGTGVVVDAERGYVVVDRNTIPEAMGDVRLTFGGTLEIPARVVAVHPLHNLALVAYDPALIGDTPVEPVRLGSVLPDPGDELWVIGLRDGDKLVAQPTSFSSLEAVNYPLSRTMRFRESNLETLVLLNPPRDIDGVVTNRKGEVVALWSSFAWQGNGQLRQENRGMLAEYVAELLERARSGQPLHSLEVEWAQTSLADARRLGLPAGWAERIAGHDPERRRILGVTRTVAGSPAAGLLQPGDLLLAIDGVPATRFREVERLTQKPAVSLEVLRNSEVLSLEVATVPLDGAGIRRAVLWAGALLQTPYRDLAAQRGVEPTGVYVSYHAFGSPASRYGLFAGRRITGVDGTVIAGLDEFIAVISGKRNRDSVRLTTVTWNGQVEVLTLRLDDTYWPSSQISWLDGQWRREALLR